MTMNLVLFAVCAATSESAKFDMSVAEAVRANSLTAIDVSSSFVFLWIK